MLLSTHEECSIRLLNTCLLYNTGGNVSDTKITSNYFVNSQAR